MQNVVRQKKPMYLMVLQKVCLFAIQAINIIDTFNFILNITSSSVPRVTSSNFKKQVYYKKL